MLYSMKSIVQDFHINSTLFVYSLGNIRPETMYKVLQSIIDMLLIGDSLTETNEKTVLIPNSINEYQIQNNCEQQYQYSSDNS